MSTNRLAIPVMVLTILMFFADSSLAAPQHYLITDTNNHRVVEVDADRSVTWQYGTVAVSDDVMKHKVAGIPGRENNRLNFPLSAERLKDGNTLIAEGDNQRVIEVTPAGRVVWSFQAADLEGLFYPVRARRLENGNTLITDWAGHRVVEVSRKREVVWQYGKAGISGGSSNKLSYPQDAVRLKNRNTLITDTENQRVIEVDGRGHIMWQFGTIGIAWGGSQYLRHPLGAVRLRNGNTLITDEGNSRVIEVDRSGQVVWQYGGSKGIALGQLNSPHAAVRLRSGDTLITDPGNHRVIVVSQQGAVVWQYGDSYRPGVGSNQLQYPSDAREVEHPIYDPTVAKKLQSLPPLNDQSYSLNFLWIVGSWAIFCFALIFGLYFYTSREHRA